MKSTFKRSLSRPHVKGAHAHTFPTRIHSCNCVINELRALQDNHPQGYLLHADTEAQFFLGIRHHRFILMHALFQKLKLAVWMIWLRRPVFLVWEIHRVKKVVVVLLAAGESSSIRHKTQR